MQSGNYPCGGQWTLSESQFVDHSHLMLLTVLLFDIALGRGVDRSNLFKAD